MESLERRTLVVKPPFPPLIAPSGATCHTLSERIALLSATHFAKASPLPAPVAILPNPISPAFDLVSSTTSEFNDALTSLREYSAPGPDGVTPELLKLAVQESASFRALLKLMVDNCITHGVFPTLWKRSVEAFVPKGSQKPLELPTSYRPISLICAPSRLVEYIISRRFLYELNRRNLLPHAHGAVPGTSISEALGHLVDAGRELLHPEGYDEKQRLDRIAILTVDVSAAYNSVDHERLVQELHKAGLSNLALWIGAWLAEKTGHFRLGISRSSARLSTLATLVGFLSQLFVLFPTSPEHHKTGR